VITKMELFVLQTVANVLDLEVCDQSQLGLRFEEDLKADDLHLLWLLDEIEKSLAIEIPIDAFFSFKTIGDVVKYLEEYYRIK
jgi:acyl carrier protein